jgi:signal transduction histidine kinase
MSTLLQHHLIQSYSEVGLYDGVFRARGWLSEGRPVVVKDEGRFCGVLTGQDLLHRSHVLVADCLVEKPILHLSQTIEEVLEMMAINRWEYLPVCKTNEMELVGLVSNTWLIQCGLTQTDHDENKVADLQKLLALKDRFLSILSHDVKNLFHQLGGTLEMLDRKLLSLRPEEIKNILALSRESTHAIHLAFENMVNWANASHREILFRPIAISLQNQFEKMARAFKLAADGKGINMVNRLTEDMSVHADLHMVTSILLNLTFNAIKFTGSGGTITFQAHRHSHAVQITVSDTGRGIPAQELAKIFHQKINTVGTNKERGTGMGLMLCREFVEKHGGRIWIESEAGKGTQVHFTLPDL